MSTKIRLARAGAKKKPFYRIVVANSTAPRDGDFLEKVGTYNPLLLEDNKVVIKADRVAYWLGCGAQPTDRVAKFIKDAGIALPTHLQKKMSVKFAARTIKKSKAESKG
jgi:small subunit ribosomal protein S16